MRERECHSFSQWNGIIISAIIFAVLTLLVMYNQEVKTFDTNFLKIVRDFTSPYPIAMAVAISKFGFSLNLLWPQITVSTVLLSHRKYYNTFLFLGVMQGAFYSLSYFRELVCRERPCTWIPYYSFPSWHTTTAACLYGIVVYLILHYVRNKFWKYFLAILGIMFIIAVAFTRMWLNAHYLTDVLAGLALGFFWVNIFIIVNKLISFE